MKKQKKDVISEEEFTGLIKPIPKHHFPLPPDETIPNDENSNAVKETLIGMEFDLERNEDIQNENEIPDEDLDYLMSEDAYFDEDYDDDIDEEDDFLIETEEDNIEANPTAPHLL